jgi:hypothetical protein
MNADEKKAISSLVRPKPQGKVLDTTKVGDKSQRTLPIRGR